MKKFFQTKTIKRYFFSYVMMFFLPLILLNAVFQFYFQKILQNELRQNNQLSLEKVQLSVEAKINNLELISDQIILNDYDVAFDASKNPVRGQKLIQFLSAFANTNPFLSDLLIYHENDYLYSQSSSLSRKYFQKLYLNQPEILQNTDELFKGPRKLYTTPPSIIIPKDINKREHIVLIDILSTNGNNTGSLLLYIFSGDRLNEICRQFYDPNITTVIITNQDGETLSIFGENIDTSVQSQFMVATVFSEELGWTYTAYTQLEAALSSSHSLQSKQLLFTLLTTLMGGLLILLCTYYNLLPLYQLIDFSSNLDSKKPGRHFKNELDAITDTLNWLSSENATLHKYLENSQLASKEYIIGQLLTGHAMKREFLDHELMETIMSPHYDRYTVFMLHFNQEALLPESARAELIQEIEAFSNKDMVFMCKEAMAFNTFVVVTFMNHRIAPQFPIVLDSVKRSLDYSQGSFWACGAGKIYELMDSLSMAYMEASTALDYRFVKGSDSVIFFHSIESIVQGDTSAYPHEKIVAFKRALSDGNANALENILTDISTFLSSGNMTLFQSRSICQDIISAVNKSLPGMQEEGKEQLLPNVFLLSRYDNVNDIIRAVKQLSYDVCKQVSVSYDETNQLLIKNIRTYVEENCYDPSFSLETTADYFHMASSNLSTLYKSYMHENVYDTVSRLRLEKAKSLLQTTALSINQIGMNVGYDNVSSFIRRFKQFTQMTPGAWRDMYGDAEPDGKK